MRLALQPVTLVRVLQAEGLLGRSSWPSRVSWLRWSRSMPATAFFCAGVAKGELGSWASASKYCSREEALPSAAWACSHFSVVADQFSTLLLNAPRRSDSPCSNGGGCASKGPRPDNIAWMLARVGRTFSTPLVAL